MPPPAGQYGFDRSMRLHGSPAFDAVFEARLKKNIGPLTFFAKANDLPHPRMGLSVSRRVGGAVVRNRIKRMLREAFRLGQHDWPRGYDVVVVVRPHAPMALTEYQRLFASAIQAVHAESERRDKKNERPES